MDIQGLKKNDCLFISVLEEKNVEKDCYKVR